MSAWFASACSPARSAPARSSTRTTPRSELPELLFDVLVEAGLAAAFIPVFARLRSTEDGIADADRFARTVLTLSIVIMGVGSVLLFIFAEGTTEIIAPGFTGAQRALYLDLFRIMLVTQVLFAASLTLGQVLLADRRYFWYALAPILYSTRDHRWDARIQ